MTPPPPPPPPPPRSSSPSSQVNHSASPSDWSSVAQAAALTAAEKEQLDIIQELAGKHSDVKDHHFCMVMLTNLDAIIATPRKGLSLFLRALRGLCKLPGPGRSQSNVDILTRLWDGWCASLDNNVVNSAGSDGADGDAALSSAPQALPAVDRSLEASAVSQELIASAASAPLSSSSEHSSSQSLKIFQAHYYADDSKLDDKLNQSLNLHLVAFKQRAMSSKVAQTDMISALCFTLSARYQYLLSTSHPQAAMNFATMVNTLKGMAYNDAAMSIYSRKWDAFALRLGASRMLQDFDEQLYSLRVLRANLQDAFVDKDCGLRNKLHSLAIGFSWASSIAARPPAGASNDHVSSIRLALTHHAAITPNVNPSGNGSLDSNLPSGGMPINARAFTHHPSANAASSRNFTRSGQFNYSRHRRDSGGSSTARNVANHRRFEHHCLVCRAFGNRIVVYDRHRLVNAVDSTENSSDSKSNSALFLPKEDCVDYHDDQIPLASERHESPSAARFDPSPESSPASSHPVDFAQVADSAEPPTIRASQASHDFSSPLDIDCITSMSSDVVDISHAQRCAAPGLNAIIDTGAKSNAAGKQFLICIFNWGFR